MKVYIVQSESNEWASEAVFSTKEKAEAFIESFREEEADNGGTYWTGLQIEVHEVDKPGSGETL